MKAVVENQLDYSLIGIFEVSELMTEFTRILGIINQSKDESMLKNVMSASRWRHFVFGFGGEHMWVAQKKNEKVRIIYVFFPNINSANNSKEKGAYRTRLPFSF